MIVPFSTYRVVGHGNAQIPGAEILAAQCTSLVTGSFSAVLPSTPSFWPKSSKSKLAPSPPLAYNAPSLPKTRSPIEWLGYCCPSRAPGHARHYPKCCPDRPLTEIIAH